MVAGVGNEQRNVGCGIYETRMVYRSCSEGHSVSGCVAREDRATKNREQRCDIDLPFPRNLVR